MFRYLFATLVLAATLSMSGCVLGPCGGGQCNDCDGASCGSYAAGPLESLRGWRRGLTCSSGCGEIYYDEWSSTPPDCEDPCQFAGGGCGRGGLGSRLGGCTDICGCGDSGCHGGCGFQPLRRVAGAVVGLYGKRFCGDCGYAVDDCGCDGGDPWSGYGGGECCDGCSGGGGGGGGCASGNCGIAQRGADSGSQVVSGSQSNSRDSLARQQVKARQSMSARTNVASSRPARQQNARPQAADPPQKFYRQATRLPEGPAALRR